MGILLRPLDRSSGVTLLDQLCEQVSLLIERGILKPGMRLPSCRSLARQLGVSCNTVVGAYNNLLNSGLLESRPRRGYFVHPQAAANRCGAPAQGGQGPGRPSSRPLFEILPPALQTGVCRTIERPANWSRYPYPFVCNQTDVSRFSLAEWRKCCYQVLNRHHATLVSSDQIDSDCDDLVEQIRCRLLPRRGIQARPEEILVTAGAQQAIFLCAMLLGGTQRRIAVEDPCYPDGRNIFQQFFGEVRPIGVDREGLVCDRRLHGCHLVYVTPNHQFPTSVRLSPARRERLLESADRDGLVIVEDDYDCETDFDPSILPALRADRRGDRVIYIGSLSKSHSPGVRIGYLVASPDFIAEARALRGMMIRQPPPFMQLAVAQFIRVGHYDALITRLQRIYRRRRQLALQALTRLFPEMQVVSGPGSTNFLVTATAGTDLTGLVPQALQAGVVIEPVDACYADPAAGRHRFRIGVSSIPARRIQAGLERLRTVCDGYLEGGNRAAGVTAPARSSGTRS